jgi:glycosyltransferase involved in cell wall biosynthesis
VGTGFGPIPSKGAYGAERTIHFLSSALAALGHEVTVLDIVTEDRDPSPYQLAEVPLRWRKDINLITHILRGFSFRLASGRGLKDLLSRDNFDIVNFHNQFSAHHIDLAHRHNMPAVYSLHNALWYNDWACRSQWQRLKFFQDVKAMRKADAVICQNNTTRLNLARYLGIAVEKTTLIPLGIDESWFEDVQVSEVVRKQYAPNNERVVVNVARIAPYKNQLTLAKAIPLVVQKMPGVRFLFVGPVGDKGYFRRVHQVIAKAGVKNNVDFLGEVFGLELRQLYSLSDVVACPSSSEAFGIMVMEGMAKGKPTVASDLETFQEMLGQERGILVPVFDHEALAEAIMGLLRNDSLRQQMGERVKEHVRCNYTWENVAKRTLEVYHKMVKSGSVVHP